MRVNCVYVPAEGPLESFIYEGSDGGFGISGAFGEKLGLKTMAPGTLASAFCDLGYWITVVSRPDAETEKLPYNVRATQLLQCWRIYGPAILLNERVVGAVSLTCAEVEELLALHCTVIPAEKLNKPVNDEAVADLRRTLLREAQNFPRLEKEVRMCISCEKQGPWQLCGRCHGPFYCSTACQRTHWKNGHAKGCGQGLYYDQ